MEEKLKTILENILNMPQEQRAFIAGQLIDSLDEDIDVDVEMAWQKEIQRRMKNAGKGRAIFMSWEDAKTRLRG